MDPLEQVRLTGAVRADDEHEPLGELELLASVRPEVVQPHVRHQQDL